MESKMTFPKFSRGVSSVCDAALAEGGTAERGPFEMRTVLNP